MINPMLITAALPLAQEVIGLFKKVTDNDISMAEAQSKIEEILTKRMTVIAELLKGQIEINKTESEAGRLGWRNWLGIGATVAFLYGALLLPVLESILALTSLFGVPTDAIMLVKQLLPSFNYEMLFELLFGLLGIYGLRGWEKSRYSAQRTEFNKSAFYDALRVANRGPLSQSEVDLLEKAFNNMKG